MSSLLIAQAAPRPHPPTHSFAPIVVMLPIIVMLVIAIGVASLIVYVVHTRRVAMEALTEVHELREV